MEQNIHTSMSTGMPIMGTTIITGPGTVTIIRIPMSITTARDRQADTSPG